MLFALALIPVILLLVFIYKKDKNEKEPIGLLIGLFFAGLATCVTAVIGEAIGMAVLDIIFPYESVIQQYILALLIVGPAEELGKFLVLWLITWKNKHFNYSYDAIVYAVFASLGFAAIENVGYVFQQGLGTAILRMFTSIPGHTCFAVFMGFFYSKAKYAAVTKNKKALRRNIILAMVVPIVIHGLYDAILFGARVTDEEVIVAISVLAWIAYIIALFVFSFIVVHRSAKNDFCIITLPDQVQSIYRPNVIGSWVCDCGTTNYLNFCCNCGKQRPVDTRWTCPTCGSICTFKFCGQCGSSKPE